MSEFINTVDVVGDDALTDSLINRSIVQFADNTLTFIGKYTFSGCKSLAMVDLPSVSRLSHFCFSRCTTLNALVLRGSTIVTLEHTNAFSYSSVASGTGYIYVPSVLIDSYKAATNWSTYANLFRALEDYTVDGTTTGELDSTKI